MSAIPYDDTAVPLIVSITDIAEGAHEGCLWPRYGAGEVTPSALNRFAIVLMEPPAAYSVKIRRAVDACVSSISSRTHGAGEAAAGLLAAYELLHKKKKKEKSDEDDQ